MWYFYDRDIDKLCISEYHQEKIFSESKLKHGF